MPRALRATSILSLALLASTPGAAGTFSIDNDTRLVYQGQSWQALRDQHVVRQRYDYSCGAAALATLLRYGLDDALDEADVLTAVFEQISGDDKSLRQKEGLTLLDLQRVAQGRGHRAQGFFLKPEFLPRLTAPVLVYIEPRGYEHFAVLRGVRGDRVYLADPSRGNVRLSLQAFLDIWLDETGRGVILVAEHSDRAATSPSLLAAPAQGEPRAELLSIRQMLMIGSRPYHAPRPLR